MIGDFIMKLSIKLLVLISLICVGCDSPLNQDPIGQITPDQIDNDPSTQTLESTVNSSYQLLSNTLNIIGDWNWAEGKVLRNDFILQDIASGDMNKKWQSDGDQAWMDRVGNFSFTPTNQAFQGIWSYDYEGISRANRAIDDLTNEDIIGKTNIDNAQRNRLLGEAYFLRAFYYFDLVANFGDVPLILEPLENFDSAFARTVRISEVEVWDQIRNDFTEAERLLPDQKYSSNSEPWRISIGAAKAMLAKVALYNEDWQNVINIINELEALEYYSLNSEYFHSFSVEQEYQEDEVIFSYNHEANQTPSEGNGLSALMGWGFVAPTEDFLNEFEQNDPRLDYTVNVDNQSIYKLLGSTTDEYKGNEDSPGNKVYIRWADVLLWKAEALNETGDHSEAIATINSIRERARTSTTVEGEPVPEGTLPDRDINTTDEEQIMDWLIHERRVELGFESHRLNDLKRWEIAGEVLNSMGKSYSDRHRFYPIPQSEIDKSGGEMEQNTGY